MLIFLESHVGVAWRLKNEIPNSHILDQVSYNIGQASWCANTRVITHWFVCVL